MPSASFSQVPIDSIIVNRAARQRREPTGIEDLAASITRRGGLINPILVHRETLELIAGERRLLACRSLGWTSIPVQFEDEVDERELKLLELEENTKRLDLPWQDTQLAIAEYHSLQTAADPSWTKLRTAEALNIDDRAVGDALNITREIQSGNTVVAEAPKFSTARGIVRRAEERKATSEISALKAVEDAPKVADAVLNEDFIEWSKTYSGPRFNLIHCDFPYGINAGERNQGYAHKEHGDYDDSAETYFSLLSALAKSLPRIALDQCHLVFWFSMSFYSETLRFFAERTDFIIDPFPLIWLKSDNKGLLPDAERGPRRLYETALFGSRGDRKIVRAVSNAVALPTAVSDGHMSVKPQPMLEYFFRMLVDSSTVMLDPTCGSGSALRAARALGADSVLGLEKNPEFAARANELMRRKA